MNWSSETLFFNGDEYFEDVLRAIAEAQHSVQIETYIYCPDEIGRRFENAMLAARARGVQVQLLVDGIGAAAWIPLRDRRLESSGVEIRVYHPIVFSNLVSRVMMDLGLRRSTRKRGSALLSRLNRRDHRKLICIDRARAWVGSLNISAEHSEKTLGLRAWTDTAIAVSGEAVEELALSFDNIWRRSHDVATGKRKWSESVFRRPNFRKHPLVRFNITNKLRRRYFKDFLRRIRKARQRIWITNAYLAPSAPVSLELCRAAQRGVDVRLLVPNRSDVFFMPLVTRSHYQALLAERVQIFEYQPRFLHAKNVIIDDWTVVGTSNMNRRSLLHDFEVDVVATSPRSLDLLVEEFQRRLSESTRITQSNGFFAHFLGRLIEWFLSYWI